MRFEIITVMLIASAWTAPNLIAQCLASDSSATSATILVAELDRKAQVDFRQGNFVEAAKYFSHAACVALEPQRSYYHQYELVARALERSDFDQARKVLQEADRQQPDYPLPLAMLVKVNLASGDIKRVKESLLVASQRFPVNVRLHSELAQDLVHEKQLDLALAESLRAVSAGAVDGRTGLNLAVLEDQAGAFADAARDASAIESQLQLTARMRAAAAAVAGMSFASLGQSKEAIEFFHIAIRLDPQQEPPYLSLARIFAAQHDIQAEEEILKQARDAVGGSPKILLALATAFISTQHYASAVQVLAGLIDSSPSEFEAYLKLAEAYRNLRQPMRATATLEELSRRKPDDPMLHIIIARSLLDEEAINYDHVLQEIATTEKISPDDYDVNYLRGKVFLAMGRYKEAAVSLGRAVDLRPTESAAHYQLALLYRKVGKSDLAHYEFERVKYLKGFQSPAGRPE